jgi:hypothetical protein
MGLSRDLLVLLASDRNVAALERLYARIIDSILKELAAGVSRAGAGRARETLIRIRELAAQINPRRDSQLRDWIRRELPKAFILGDRDTAQEVRRQLADAAAARIADVQVSGTFSAVSNSQLNILIATMISRMEDVHRQVLQTSGFVIRTTQLRAQTDAEIREHIVDGIIRGKAGREVSNDIAKAILTGKIPPAAAERLRAAGHAADLELYKQLAQGQFITVGKKRMDVRAYANLVAKTMTRDAATVATIARLQQSGVNHIQVSPTMPTEPDVCSLVAGNVYYIGAGEDDLGFPAYASMPGGKLSLHPHCRHVALPYVAALKSQPFTDELRDNVFAAESFFGSSSAEASKRIHELVKAGGIAAIHKYNPRLFGMVPPARSKGVAA